MENEKKYIIKRRDIYNFAYGLIFEYSNSNFSCMFDQDNKQVDLKKFSDEFINSLQIYNPKFREIDDDEWDMLPGSSDLDDCE